MRFTISARFISTASWYVIARGVATDNRAVVEPAHSAGHGIPDAHLGHITKAARWMRDETIRPASLELELDGVQYLVTRPVDVPETLEQAQAQGWALDGASGTWALRGNFGGYVVKRTPGARTKVGRAKTWQVWAPASIGFERRMGHDFRGFAATELDGIQVAAQLAGETR